MFEARFARVVSVGASIPVVNAVGAAKDESSEESSSEDDTEAIEREKQLAALQQQVFAHHLLMLTDRKQIIVCACFSLLPCRSIICPASCFWCHVFVTFFVTMQHYGKMAVAVVMNLNSIEEI